MQLKKNNLSVCLSPVLFPFYNHDDSIIVIVDLLRATSVISTAFEYGIKDIIPVKSLDEAKAYQNIPNHIIAAERNTKIVEGFQFGNSPYHYMENNIIDKTLVLTTTNGTKAIHLVKENIVVTASFININSITEYLKQQDKDVVILCSGWKNRFNLEDTIFAGALSNFLIDTNLFKSNCDSLLASQNLYKSGKTNLFEFLDTSAYRNRNNSSEVIRDTKFCLHPTFKSNIIPIFKKDRLIRLEVG